MSGSQSTPRRRFIDAPDDQRCKSTITLRDGSKAQCGRYGKVSDLCRQHHKMLIRLLGRDR